MAVFYLIFEGVSSAFLPTAKAGGIRRYMPYMRYWINYTLTFIIFKATSKN
jgi:hypothetical protein